MELFGFFRKLIRVISLVFSFTLNELTVFFLQNKYIRCDLHGTKLGKNVNIVCSDNSSIFLKNCEVSDGVKIKASKGGKIVANNVFFGVNSIIVSVDEIIIGNNTLIAEFVVIRDQNHKYNGTNIAIKEQGFDSLPISIGENVWVGAKATILPGAKIGDSVVIGAHSLVNSPISSNSVAFGTPAKHFKKIK